jgi:hypothetical protein
VYCKNGRLIQPQVSFESLESWRFATINFYISYRFLNKIELIITQDMVSVTLYILNVFVLIFSFAAIVHCMLFSIRRAGYRRISNLNATEIDEMEEIEVKSI